MARCGSGTGRAAAHRPPLPIAMAENFSASTAISTAPHIAAEMRADVHQVQTGGDHLQHHQRRTTPLTRPKPPNGSVPPKMIASTVSSR